VVVSGPVAAVEAAERRFLAEKWDARRLPVSAAFHSLLVSGACAPFRVFLEDIGAGAARVPVYSNRTGQLYPTAGAEVRDEVARAIAEPVWFATEVEAMYAAGARVFVEVGPGAVLTKLVERCLAGRPHLAVELDSRGKNGVTAFWDALARLSVAGVELAFDALWQEHALPEAALPTPASKLTLTLTGANYGKPTLPEPPPREVMSKPPNPEPPPQESSSFQQLPGISPVHASVIAAHTEYLRLMAETHTAFLQAIAASYGAGAPLPSQSAPVAVPGSVAMPAPVPAAAPVYVAPEFLAPPPLSPPPAIASIPEPAPRSAPEALDLVTLMLSIVAEKTGYPAEMIELGMDLESDLGIDSIKRVEILAAVNSRVPGLPAVDTARMARMRTLSEIVDFLRGGTPEPAVEPQVARFATRAIAARPRGFAVFGLLQTAEVCVTPDGGGVAAAVVRRFGELGIGATVVDAVPAQARAVVFLGGLRPIAKVEDALAVEREAFVAARTLASRFRGDGGVFVTVQDTGGDFGLAGRSGDRAYLAGLGALAKTAAAEWPRASVRALDVERGHRHDDELARAIVDELVFGGPELEVGLCADATRTAVTAVPVDLPVPVRPLRKGAVFVVSGGARGVTAASLIALARETSPRLLLLGRSRLSEEPEAFRGVFEDTALKRAALAEVSARGAAVSPKELAERVAAIVAAREIRSTLRELESLGSEVRYEAVDVRDTARLDAVLARVRGDWGPIQGLVHGAGVLSDALLDNKTDAQFEQVFDTKVLGLRALLDATRGDPLEWLALFSSVAARSGNAGQADYAMANEVLNKVAAVEARRRGKDCRVVSICWGPWDGGMVTPSLRSQFERRGVPLLGLESGARAFVRELRASGEVEVGIGGGSAHTLRGDTERVVAGVLVNQSSWPQLASHCIRGRVVLPVAVVVEWFTRLARPFRRDAGPVELRDVRVVCGVPLAGYFTAKGDRFQLIAEPASGGHHLKLELRDERGELRYSAVLDRRTTAPPPSARPIPDPELGSSPWGRAELYSPSTLFHGEHFQVLRSVDGISATHARATLSGTRDAGWAGEWHSEPAALDGALQLALLFGIHGGVGQTLPMRIERVSYFPDREPGPIRCDLVERKRTREGLSCDLSLTDSVGASVLDLHGVELFVVPHGTAG
jgi:NADP-dependent 3-hydroxy acid dehydrogenase YdfG